MNLSSSIPAGPSDITPEWLTAALREERLLHEMQVVAVDSEIIGEDRGFTGIVARLVLRFDRHASGVPSSMIAKFPLAKRMTESSYRALQDTTPEQERRYFGRCAREVEFYRQVARHNDIAPVVYYARSDRETGRIVLLLEDLSDGEPGDALHGCPASQAEVVVNRIARFHALWWDHPELDRLDWLPPWGGDPGKRADRYRGQVDPVLERYGDQIPQQVRDLAVRLTDRYADILRELANGSVTMIHADLHLDNVIFTQLTGRQLAKIIDWQSVSLGKSAIDLSLFIAGSLDVTDRRRVEQDLLERYRRTLVTNGVTGHSFDHLLNDYRLALLWQLAGTVGWLSRVDLGSLEGRERDLIEAIFTKGQLFAALQDHEVFNLIDQ